MKPITAPALPQDALHRLRQNQHWLLVLAGLAVLYVPTMVNLFRTVWATDAQGHGPIVLAISIWLVWRQRELLDGAAPTCQPRPALAWPVIVFGALLYAFGRSQEILLFEVGSLIPMTAGAVLLFSGTYALRKLWFAWFFMIFMVPLPSAVVDALTQPMKIAVSYVATSILHFVGYPVARSGVIMTVGQYQLLVADACAGLHTLFTLEALGLLYLNIIRSSSLVRNVTLAVLVVPISFLANVTRVIVLTLITYHFGDAAGQGFLHGFAGMVLFLTALMMIIAADGVVRVVVARWTKHQPGQPA